MVRILDRGPLSEETSSAESSVRSAAALPRIVAAAVLVDGLVCALPRPARHSSLIRAIADAAGVPVNGVQGFVTDRNTFVDRAEAANIAFAAGQVDAPKDELFSEDLW